MESRYVVEVGFLTRGRREVSSERRKHDLPYGEGRPYRRDPKPDSSRKVESDDKLRCSGGALSSIQC
jgi:hypothetical protein